jgi:deoxyribodipyrimidine photo-lyase
VDRVVTARDYEPYARARDAQVAAAVNLVSVKDTVVREPGEVFSQAGTPFRVYTPYSKVWRSLFSRADLAEKVPDFGALAPLSLVQPHWQSWTLGEIGFEEAPLWVAPGEDAAGRSLAAFEHKMDAYGETRDVPSAGGTSVLSPHFRFGTVSIRAAYRAAFTRESKGADKWISELIWREFYQDVLFHHPYAVERPIQEQYAHLEFPGTPGGFEAWVEGRTGYPIVDAAMRSFLATGWMHNRLRMVVASFLTKDLLIDYREGEAHFARYLLDFDLASNNGGWQWAASVGCDAQPYFRIFNPVLQGLKFDPDGSFVHAWVPELRGLTGEALHSPWTASGFDLAAAGVELDVTYPRPIVDHSLQKDRAIRLLGSVTKG